MVVQVFATELLRQMQKENELERVGGLQDGLKMVQETLMEFAKRLEAEGKWKNGKWTLRGELWLRKMAIEYQFKRKLRKWT
jgi:alkylhydroperoxidase/carboxymuconolactone decarboxylase family protein YurZ